MDAVHEFLHNHIDTKRAKKCTPVVMSKTNSLDNQLSCLSAYKFDFDYPSTRIAPSLIKVGFKDERVCIRIDETERQDRQKFNDYYADDLNHLKRLIAHLARLQRDYDRTTWFLRAQLIPTLFKGIIELIKQRPIALA